MVFTYHAGFLSIGWSGVSVFFVLSGLLITGILRRSRNDHSYWRPFYIKRATRILPPLLIAFIGAAVFSKIQWQRVGFFQVFFLANVADALHPESTGTLGVLWSLAVEEQFYFVWPFAVRALNRIQLIYLLTGVLIAEPILRGLVTPATPNFYIVYFLTPFQLDGLALGSLMALLLEDEEATRHIKRFSGWIFAAGVFAFSVLSLLPEFHRRQNTILFNSVGYSLVYLSAAGFIAVILLHDTSHLSKIMGSRLAVFFGTISYGLYLFHPLALDLAGRACKAMGFHHAKEGAPFALATVTAISWLSFTFYERPLIRIGREWANPVQARGASHADAKT